MRSVTLRSPAKLNLLLKVINKRPDGYHNLETLFERIDLCDQLEFKSKKTGNIQVLCDHPQMP
ncbi:MAG: 4-(cytidine 5'-diphospho)-2-C-methyl-D-erythritol kinase, partial [Gammaproteobacteria bacterium]|nr:4-(cytidine 5'-diphospho)-2-C-methyl-D-erythritol kinase [Gammaproteobacteria bacterium]